MLPVYYLETTSENDVVVTGPDSWKDRLKVVAIGMFDGVHLGHKMVFSRVRQMADDRNCASCALTFDKHPLSLVSPGGAPLALSTFEERCELILGNVERLIVARFESEFANMSPEDFARRVLVETLEVKAAVVGYDFRFGRRASGDTELLERLGSEYGFDVEVVEPYRVSGQIASSTQVRRMLTEGRIEEANSMLGRPYAIKGAVISGRGKGRTLGFPTANVSVPATKLMPADGVYWGRVKIRSASGGEVYGLAALGNRPTFESCGDRSFEIHVLDLDKNIYGEDLEYEFMGRLRDIEKFETTGELAQQIENDIGAIKRLTKEVCGKIGI